LPRRPPELRVETDPSTVFGYAASVCCAVTPIAASTLLDKLDADEDALRYDVPDLMPKWESISNSARRSWADQQKEWGRSGSHRRADGSCWARSGLLGLVGDSPVELGGLRWRDSKRDRLWRPLPHHSVGEVWERSCPVRP
jgi:hypothetical protein